MFALSKLFVSSDTYNKFVRDYKEKKIRYVEMKNVLTEAIYKDLRPFQEKRKEFENNPTLVDSIIEEGQIKCSRMAEETMKEVRLKMGLV